MFAPTISHVSDCSSPSWTLCIGNTALLLSSARYGSAPIWLDAHGHRRPTLACWTCGREVAPMRFRGAALRPHGWAAPRTLQIPDWCGRSTEYLPMPESDGRWILVPIWDPAQTRHPLRRWEPGVPYWAAAPRS